MDDFKKKIIKNAPKIFNEMYSKIDWDTPIQKDFELANKLFFGIAFYDCIKIELEDRK